MRNSRLVYGNLDSITSRGNRKARPLTKLYLVDLKPFRRLFSTTPFRVSLQQKCKRGVQNGVFNTGVWNFQQHHLDSEIETVRQNEARTTTSAAECRSTRSETSDWMSDLSADARLRLEELRNEYVIWSNADDSFPDAGLLKKSQWITLLSLKTAQERLMYWTFLSKKFVLCQKASEMKALRRVHNTEITAAEERVEPRTDQERLRYAYGYNSIFRRIEPVVKALWNLQRYPLISEFGPKIVLDLSLMSHAATHLDLTLTAKQLLLAYSLNVNHRLPSNLIFAGYSPNTKYCREVDRFFHPNGVSNYRMCTVSERSVTELFPRRQLVYLSPDAPNAMKKFDSDKVYVIGGLVDKTRVQKGVSFQLAQRMGVECVKLPLDDYVTWMAGKKCLVIPHVLKILLDVHMTGDWRTSFLSSIPNRNLMPSSPERSAAQKSRFNDKQDRKNFLLSLIQQ